MKRVLPVAIVAALIAAAVFSFGPSARRRFDELHSDLSRIRGDTGDVMASATYQRYATRRASVEKMRAGLRSIAVVESAFVADSGHPTSVLLSEGPYAFTTDPANLISIDIKRDRWVAQAHNTHTSMSCFLTAILDTTGPRWRYHAGEPVCAEWTAESVAVAAAASPQSAEQDQSSRPRVVDQPSGPGTVNNTPPPMPWVLEGICPDGNCRFGQWTACSTIVVTRDKRGGSPELVTLRRGDEFTALRLDAVVQRPGVIGFRNAITMPLEKRDATGPVVTIFHLTPADTLYPLVQTAEREMVFWFRGAADTGAVFWRPDPAVYRPDALRASVLIRSPAWTSWVRIRDVDGREGWAAYDVEKMSATTADDVKDACLSENEG